MSPALMTPVEVRVWLRSLDLRGIRLPKPGKVLVVDQPGGGLWIVEPHESGAYLVSPHDGTDTLLARKS